jgi:hypothetical protein
MVRRAAHSVCLAFILGSAALIPGLARAEDYPACAKIENPFAYNQCLATQGPPAHETRGIAPPADADRPKGAWPSAQGAPTRSTMQIAHIRGGRMVLELTVGSPATASAPRRPRKTR